MIFIVDASALHALRDACATAEACADVLDEMSDLANGKELCLCGASAKALKVLDQSAATSVWASATAKTEWFPKGDWQKQQRVATGLDGYADWDLLVETPEVVEVLTLALFFDPDDIVIVTEDTIDKPDLLSTTTAAAVMGFSTCSLAEFLAQADLEDLAVP